VIDDRLRYAQVIKSKAGGVIREVKKRVIFGKDIDPKEISTSLVERQNLTLRQEKNRISRKTMSFSKKLSGLDEQMTFVLCLLQLLQRRLVADKFGSFGKEEKK
jgi:hypothetical protein